MPRVDVLRKIPAIVRFVSIEPLLEDLGQIDLAGIQWCIIGGESGPSARPFDVVWADSIIGQCRKQAAAPWLKQLGRKPMMNGKELRFDDVLKSYRGKGEDFELWPNSLESLKVRELPAIDSNDLSLRQHVFEAQRADGQFAVELDKIAAELSPNDAAVEHRLRERWVLNREDRNNIIADYHRLLSPLRLWTRFLNAIGLPRQTAYDMKAAAERVVRTESVQSESQTLFPIIGKRNGQTGRA